MTHDPLCPRKVWLSDREYQPVCLCPEFSAVRQDESVKATARALADLRARVEGLPETQPMDPWNWEEVVEVVLALIDEARADERDNGWGNVLAVEIRAQADRRIAGVDLSLPCMTAWERGYDQATDAAAAIAKGATK